MGATGYAINQPRENIMKTDTNIYTRFDLLSIDAWRECEGGWTWNAWYNLEKDIYFAESELTPRKVLKALRKWGFLSDESKGKVSLDDDGYNIVIQDKDTYEPIFALAYGQYQQ
jgi:hypothetical protein